MAWELAAGGAEGVWALSCAALRSPLPPAAETRAPPPPELVAAALERVRLGREPGPARARPSRGPTAPVSLQCERRCDEEERAQRAPAADAEDPALAALLPASAEWAAARALLAPPLRRWELLARLLDAREPTSV